MMRSPGDCRAMVLSPIISYYFEKVSCEIITVDLISYLSSPEGSFRIKFLKTRVCFEFRAFEDQCYPKQKHPVFGFC
jgi:hypothetical protein